MRIETSTVVMSVEHQSSVQRTVVSQQGEVLDPMALRAASTLESTNGAALEFSFGGTGLRQGDDSVASVEAWMQAGAALDARTRVNKLVLDGFLGRHLAIAADSAVLGVRPDSSVPLDSVDRSMSLDKRVADTESSIQEVWSGGIDLSMFRLQLEEKERTHVALSADITTADGRHINVNIEQEMSRHLSIERELVEADVARFMDPLVINFSGPVRLDKNRVDFDLDGDGVKESIARFASDSAYLALDKNGDGRINNGTELFGVASNNGFDDLREYDIDGNGFIDAADPIFSQLSLYRPGFEGGISIISAGIEAFSLDYIDSPFSLKSSLGEDLGRVRSTGFYLTSTGAGSLQQIDLAV